MKNEAVLEEVAGQGAFEEEIIINAPKDDVYRHLHAVHLWPRLLPHVEAIDVIYDDGAYQEFYMSVRGTDGGSTRVRSVRRCEEGSISFFQVSPPIFLESHCGGWTFRETLDRQCVLSTYHRWKVNDHAPAVYPATRELSSDQQVEMLLRGHAQFALASWKEILEQDVTTVQEQIVIDAPVQRVYEIFAILEHWRAAIPDVLDTKLLYHDEDHQEFLMTVERPAGPETVRGFRYLKKPVRIELFQPQPPPGFKRMTGLWLFKELEQGTEVTASRAFTLELGNATPTGVAVKLCDHLKTNLKLFKQYIEAPRH